ncbi:MAG: hypothetical protein IT439_02690 [Phycisphaerales bacterium]|nr:hypothetical protein [Phycisphaerales bacterium]
MFATDRDLLVIEPHLFRDLGFLGQRVLSASGDVSGTVLSLTTPGASFVGAGVQSGHVLLLAGVACEVVDVSAPSQATVSLIRAARDGTPVAPAPGVGVSVEAWTFGPQIGIVHEQLLRVMGVGVSPEAPSESQIIAPEGLATLEALGTLHVLYAAAGALSHAASPLGARAAMYRAWFGVERQRALVRLDLDGDGVPDATRRLGVSQALRV